jgi:molybdate transport system ATP-binding protein
MLYVSQSLDERQQVADNLLVLTKGKVEHFGNIHQMIQRLNVQQINTQPESPLANYPLTSLALPIKKHCAEYSLTTLALPLKQEIHIPSGLVPSTLLPSTLEQDRTSTHVRCFILSNEMSICLTEPKNSSIVNCLSGKITDIMQAQQKVLISVCCDQQTFFVSISRYSLDTLALIIDQAVFIQFKASAVRTFINSLQLTIYVQ